MGYDSKALDFYFKYLFDPSMTPYIHGLPGIGKSTRIKELVKERSRKNPDIPIFFWDVRLAGRDPGDFGLPVGVKNYSIETSCYNAGNLASSNITVENAVVFSDPYWWISDPNVHGIIAYDEFDCADPLTQNVVMEHILDRKNHGKALSPNIWIICAGNKNEEHNNTKQMSLALESRLVEIHYEPTAEDWINWASEKDDEGVTDKNNEVYQNILIPIQIFLAKQSAFLDPPKGLLDRSHKHPDRRSWHRLSDTIRNATLRNPEIDLFNNKDDFSQSMLQLTAASHIGGPAASTFYNWYLKDFKCFMPENFLTGPTNPHDDPTLGNPAFMDLIDNKGTAATMAYYARTMARYLNQVQEITNKQLENLNVFVRHLPDAHKVLWYMALKASPAKTKWSKHTGNIALIDNALPKTNT